MIFSNVAFLSFISLVCYNTNSPISYIGRFVSEHFCPQFRLYVMIELTKVWLPYFTNVNLNFTSGHLNFTSGYPTLQLHNGL